MQKKESISVIGEIIERKPNNTYKIKIIKEDTSIDAYPKANIYRKKLFIGAKVKVILSHPYTLGVITEVI